MLEVGGLVADQREDELVIGFVEARRLDEVGLLDGVDEVGDGERGGEELRGVGDDMEFGDLAALNGDGGDAGKTIEGGLEFVRSEFPEAGGRDGGGGEGVAADGIEGGEGEAVDGDLRGRGEGLLNAGDRGIDELESLEHVDIPVEEEADFGGAAAGDGADGDEAGDGVDRVFDGPGDGDFHLLDGHDAVVDTDDDAGEVGLRKNGDGDAEGEINTGDDEDGGEEKMLRAKRGSQKEFSEDAGVGSVTCRPPLAGIGFGVVVVGGGDDFHVGAIVEGGSAGGDDLLACGEAGDDPGFGQHRRCRVSTTVWCAMPSEPMTMTVDLPEVATTMDSDGTTRALGAVRPAMETWTAVPGRRVPLGSQGGPRLRRWCCWDRERD